MSRIYNIRFKDQAVGYLKELNEKGFIYMKDKHITNVRQLCKILGISSYSLYKWKKEKERIDGIKSGLINVIEENKIKMKKEEKEEIEYKFEEKITGLKIVGKEVDIFGIRFYAWLGKNMGIENYSRMNLKQLKHTIGKQLIKESKK